MATAKAIPHRQIRLATGNPDEIEKRQPERRRSLVQLESGLLEFRLHELSWGDAAIQAERWSCGIRVVTDRPSSYLTFVYVIRGDAHWMGRSIGTGSLLRIDGPWDCRSRGPFEYVAFGVPMADYEQAADRVAGGEHPAPQAGNRILSGAPFPMLVPRLFGSLYALEQSALHPALTKATADELLELALRIDRPEETDRKERDPSPTLRLRAIRRVEDYLEAHPGVVPSIPMLCAIAGVSERTLEYAFQEHLDSTPIRYLRLRRLTLARRRLLNPDSASERVTDIAISCGIFELGRFAADYRKHFGELPSETLARSLRAFGDDDRRRSGGGNRSCPAPATRTAALPAFRQGGSPYAVPGWSPGLQNRNSAFAPSIPAGS